MYRKPIFKNETVPAGAQSKSAPIQLRDYVLAAISTPAALTSTTITFEGAEDNSGTFKPVYDTAGNLISVTVGTDRAVSLHGTAGEALAPFNFIKLVLGGTEAAARDFVLHLK